MSDKTFPLGTQQLLGFQNFLTLHFQRIAKIYLFVAAYNNAGCKSEGWMKQAPGKARSVLEFRFLLVKTVRMVVFPTKSFIKYRFVILVAGEGCVTTQVPVPPRRKDITQIGLCPKELEDVWTVKGPDTQDAAARDKDFRSWYLLQGHC